MGITVVNSLKSYTLLHLANISIVASLKSSNKAENVNRIKIIVTPHRTAITTHRAAKLVNSQSSKTC